MKKLRKILYLQGFQRILLKNYNRSKADEMYDVDISESDDNDNAGSDGSL